MISELKHSHTQDSLPTKVYICIYKHQFTDKTVSILPPENHCLHCSQVSVITATFLRQERKTGVMILGFNGMDIETTLDFHEVNKNSGLPLGLSTVNDYLTISITSISVPSITLIH